MDRAAIPLDGQTVDATHLTDDELRDGLAITNDHTGTYGPGGRSCYALDDHGVMRWEGDIP